MIHENCERGECHQRMTQSESISKFKPVMLVLRIYLEPLWILVARPSLEWSPLEYPATSVDILRDRTRASRQTLSCRSPCSRSRTSLRRRYLQDCPTWDPAGALGRLSQSKCSNRGRTPRHGVMQFDI